MSKFLGIGYDTGFGDQEQDANSALIELDKGLHSSKVGEQCEAIVRFPRLFEKYPFPILINSAFLKLADVFRDGNNFLRLCILKVTQQSSKQLDKILNVDEFVRRIFFVVHSNDPVARAITLKVLGSIAAIIAERKNVHHSIHNGLDSHDNVEVEAAIYATSCFTAQSKTFANGICNKLATLIQGLATPIEVKLKLIPIFKHMHHDAETASHVYQVCLELMDLYPVEDFLIVLLDTLNQLVCASHILVPKQIKLVIKYLGPENQFKIKQTAFQNLLQLVKKYPHMVNNEDIVEVARFCQTEKQQRLVLAGLDVLRTVSKSPTFQIQQACDELVSLSQTLSKHWNLSISSRALQLLVNVATNPACPDRERLITKDVIPVCEFLVIQSVTQSPDREEYSLKIVLKSIQHLCSCKPQFIEGFVSSLCSALSCSKGAKSVNLCHGLISLAEKREDVLIQHGMMLQEMFDQTLNDATIDLKLKERILTSLCVPLLICCKKSPTNRSFFQERAKTLCHEYSWIAFKIARQAARVVASENLYFWLSALHEFSSAELVLLNLPDNATFKEILTCLDVAVQHYQKGKGCIKAGSTPAYPLLFQLGFINHRCDWLQVCSTLISGLTTSRTCPPPAIAPAMAAANGSNLLKCGQLVKKMTESSTKLSHLSTCFPKFYRICFDADPQTLTKIQLMQRQCLLLMHVVDLLILNNPTYVGSKSLHPLETLSSLEDLQQGHDLHLQVTKVILQRLKDVLQQTEGQPISHIHTDCIRETCVSLLKLPFTMPRYFFQGLQSTSIKLALSPSQRGSGEPILVATDTHLALKIEGVVQHGSHPGLFRKVSEVKLEVMSRCYPKNPAKLAEGEFHLQNSTWQIAPHNDYFSQQVLLSFPLEGLHTVTVMTFIIDEEGRLWETDSTKTLSVKAYVNPLTAMPQGVTQPAQTIQSRVGMAR